MEMDEDLCHLCFEKCAQMKYNVQHSIENTNLQAFIETFNQFVFRDSTSTFDVICMKCWKTLQQFNQYCEKIRSIHRDSIDESTVIRNQTIEYDDQTEVLLETIEGCDSIEQECEESTVEMLLFETDADDEGSATINRRNLQLTPRVIANLEEQLKFEATTIDMDDIDFSRFARFISMECGMCGLRFDSFDEYDDHYLILHNRSAVWNCCNLVLETPYDALDHLKYHESIEHFKCAACYKCFLTSNKLKYHIRRTHLPVEGSFTCVICDKECKNLRLLLSHQKSHVRINCPHCKKFVNASNYEQHIRSIHASAPAAKRKSTQKINANASKRKADGKLAQPSTSSKRNQTTNLSTPQKCRRVQSFAVNTEPNENGLYECDICRMEFKQISLVYSHRNKVHV